MSVTEAEASGAQQREPRGQDPGLELSRPPGREANAAAESRGPGAGAVFPPNWAVLLQV